MLSFRVTKYNPQFRDAHGRYLADDWTSISDVGECFAGIELMQEAYLAIESKYLAAIRFFARDSCVSRLRVNELEIESADSDPGYEIVDGWWLDLAEAIEVARLVLREELWCKLEDEGRLRVHFGYDYYMYIESNSCCDCAVEETRELGLFVERDFPSPYSV